MPVETNKLTLLLNVPIYVLVGLAVSEIIRSLRGDDSEEFVESQTRLAWAALALVVATPILVHVGDKIPNASLKPSAAGSPFRSPSLFKLPLFAFAALAAIDTFVAVSETDGKGPWHKLFNALVLVTSLGFFGALLSLHFLFP